MNKVGQLVIITHEPYHDNSYIFGVYRVLKEFDQDKFFFEFPRERVDEEQQFHYGEAEPYYRPFIAALVENGYLEPLQYQLMEMSADRIGMDSTDEPVDSDVSEISDEKYKYHYVHQYDIIVEKGFYMAAKIASEKKKNNINQKKELCKNCTGTMQPVMFAGFGKEKGMYWVCQGNDKLGSCGNKYRTGN